MRLEITILLAILILACKGQEPDIECYSIDSVNIRETRIIQKYELKIDSVINSMYSQGYVDNIMLTKDLKIDSLNQRIIFLETVLDINETSVIADTFNFEIVDDRIKVEIDKKGHDIWIDLIDGSKRINADYINYSRSIMLMDSTYTVGSIYIK